MANVTMKQARQAAAAIEKFTGYPCKVLDWRDSGEGIRLLPEWDPYELSMSDIPGMPKGTFIEPGYGSLGIYPI